MSYRRHTFRASMATRRWSLSGPCTFALVPKLRTHRASPCRLRVVPISSKVPSFRFIRMGRSVQRGGSPGQLPGSWRRSLCPAADSKHTCTADGGPEKESLGSCRSPAFRLGMEEGRRLHSGSQRRCTGQHKGGPMPGWTLDVQVRAQADPRHSERQPSWPRQQRVLRAPEG